MPSIAGDQLTQRTPALNVFKFSDTLISNLNTFKKRITFPN